MTDTDNVTGRQIIADCVCFNLRRAARLLSRRYDEAFVETGLKNTQFSLLAALLGEVAVPITSLAENLGMDRTTLTRNLRPLERQGLLRVIPDPVDHRSRRVSLTDRGRETVEAALHKWHEVQAETLDRLGGEEWTQMRAALRTLSGPG